MAKKRNLFFRYKPSLKQKMECFKEKATKLKRNKIFVWENAQLNREKPIGNVKQISAPFQKHVHRIGFGGKTGKLTWLAAMAVFLLAKQNNKTLKKNTSTKSFRKTDNPGSVAILWQIIKMKMKI